MKKPDFFRANTKISNLNVLHKGLLLQDWVFWLGLQSKAELTQKDVVVLYPDYNLKSTEKFERERRQLLSDSQFVNEEEFTTLQKGL